MCLGDYIRFLRAMRGGITPLEVSQATGIPSREINLIELKHRQMGDDETLEKLAAYFDIPVDELRWRRDRFRKKLVAFLDEQRQRNQTVRLRLQNGAEIVGTIAWIGKSTIGFRLGPATEETAAKNLENNAAEAEVASEEPDEDQKAEAQKGQLVSPRARVTALAEETVQSAAETSDLLVLQRHAIEDWEVAA